MMGLAPLLFMTSLKMTATSGDDNPAFCCKSQLGPKVIPTSINLIDVINESPNYGQVSTINPHSLDLDNVCYTYYNIDSSSFVQFTGLRYSDGTSVLEKFIVSALTGYPGVSRIQGLTHDGGSSLVYDEVYLGRACPEVRVYYRNFFAAQCGILRNYTVGQADFIHGDSPNREISGYCVSQVTEVANSQQLRDTDLFKLPNRLNRCCVTQFNGASCVNAYRVLPQDSVSVPDTGNTCQTFYSR